MSTTTEISAVSRITRIVRLHLANPFTMIAFPWLVLGVITLGTIAIWAIVFAAVGPEHIASAQRGLQYSGATGWIFVYMIVVAAQAMAVTFPFALGYGVTRRDYYLGSALTFVLMSAMFAVGMTILSVLEEATNGWGLGGHMYTAIYFGETWYQRLFIFFAGFLFFFFIGAAIASIWVRWKATGVTVFFMVLGFLLIGAAALLTFTASWNVVGEFFVGAGLVGSVAWSLVLTVIAGLAGFGLLRGATPRT